MGLAGLCGAGTAGLVGVMLLRAGPLRARVYLEDYLVGMWETESGNGSSNFSPQ